MASRMIARIKEDIKANYLSSDSYSDSDDIHTLIQVAIRQAAGIKSLKGSSQKDPVTMRKLYIQYMQAGKSAELEKYLEQNFDKIPSKQEVATKKLKEKVSGYHEACIYLNWKVESCPSCLTARIIKDPETSVFICTATECGLEHCRRCWKEQHQPEPCSKVRKADIEETATLQTVKVDYEVVNILPKRWFDENDPMEIEFRKAESQFLRMQAKGFNTGFSIQSIDVVTNRRLEERFEARKKELLKKGFSDCLLLFHGTRQKNVDSILRNNFDTNIKTHGRVYGNGVYFSERPEVSLGYSQSEGKGKTVMMGKKQQQKQDKDGQQQDTITSLILCKVLPGDNSTEHNPVRTGAPPPKEDERCFAIVVPDVDQILPKYVINFN